MPFAVIIVAVVLITVGLRGTHAQLFCMLKQDFTGKPNFLYWVAAVFLIGMVGYIPKLRAPSDAFIVLMVVALFFAERGGLFSNINSAIGTTSNTNTKATATPSAYRTVGLEAGMTALSTALVA